VVNSGPLTDKVDVFAYGLLLWEMLALDVPHACHMRQDDTREGKRQKISVFPSLYIHVFPPSLAFSTCWL